MEETERETFLYLTVTNPQGLIHNMSTSQVESESIDKDHASKASSKPLENDKADDEAGKEATSASRDGSANSSGSSDASNDQDQEKQGKHEKDKEERGNEAADTTTANTADGQLVPIPQHDWQAIFSPQHNAYYFYNMKTQETTWTNPLVPPSESEQGQSQSPPPSTSYNQMGLVPTSTFAPSTTTATIAINPALEGIDPELAYLDPTGAQSGVGLGPASGAVPGTYAARFNARTGRFTAMDGRDPTHLSEYERAKRMSSVFFDVDAWGQEVAERKAFEDAEEAAGRRRKTKPSKADLERFKAQKEARKKTKYAWLRD